VRIGLGRAPLDLNIAHWLRFCTYLDCGKVGPTFVCMNFSKSRLRLADGSVNILLLSWLAMYTPGMPSIRPKSVMYLLLKFMVMLRLYKVLLYPAQGTS
jgi:hypothetical protein